MEELKSFRASTFNGILFNTYIFEQKFMFQITNDIIWSSLILTWNMTHI